MSDHSESPMESKIHCPECGVSNWTCYDEASAYFTNGGDDIEDTFVTVEASLRCNDCGRHWKDIPVDIPPDFYRVYPM